MKREHSSELELGSERATQGHPALSALWNPPIVRNASSPDYFRSAAEGRVKFALHEATMKAARERNPCADEGTSVGAHGRLSASSVNAPVLLWITDGTHAFDKSCVKPMVDFFNAPSRPVPTPAPAPALPTLR
jgi:hypothetical protein